MRERTITVGPILKVEARVPRVAKVGEELSIEFFIFNDGIAQEDINLDVMANRNFEFVNEVGFPVSFSTFGTYRQSFSTIFQHTSRSSVSFSRYIPPGSYAEIPLPIRVTRVGPLEIRVLRSDLVNPIPLKVKVVTSRPTATCTRVANVNLVNRPYFIQEIKGCNEKGKVGFNRTWLTLSSGYLDDFDNTPQTYEMGDDSLVRYQDFIAFRI